MQNLTVYVKWHRQGIKLPRDQPLVGVQLRIVTINTHWRRLLTECPEKWSMHKLSMEEWLVLLYAYMLYGNGQRFQDKVGLCQVCYYLLWSWRQCIS